MLTIEALRAGYGATEVLFDIHLQIAEGEVVTLMGRNGMGKTTTVRALMGQIPAQARQMRFAGQGIAGLPPEKIARLGVGLVPEGRQIFPTLSVRENLVATAANRLGRTNPWTLARVYDLFPRLQERAGQLAGTLSGGEQQMLAVGRALMTNPKLLILDEATEGLAPVIRTEIWRVIDHLKSDGQSILLIDKNLGVLRRLADRHYIIEKGRTLWTGNGTDLDRDLDRVRGLIGL